MDNKILEQRARAFDHLFDAVVVTDMQGIMIDWNAGSEALYGYSKEEALGQPVSILHVPEDTDKIVAEVLDAVQKEGKWTGEIRMLHKNGGIGWIESMVVPLLDDDGNMTGALGINRDISARVQNEERMARLAHYDQLTDLPNRYLLIDRLKQLIVHAGRNNTQFALLFIDLDKFKSINDEAGHAIGDLALKEVTRRFAEVFRASDTVARFGGDEFVILLEELNQRDDATQVAEQIMAELHRPCSIQGHNISLAASIGTAVFAEDGTTADELLNFADKAMYRVKKGQ